MAKKPKRRMGKYIRGNVDEVMLLTTLASKTLAAQAFDETVNERSLITSIVAAYSLSAFTAGNDIGPIMCGVAHGDYSAAEIEAVIENTGSWNEGDLVSQEVAKRKVRILGIFRDTQTAAGSMILNNGRPIKTKMNWILNQGETLQLWAYNLGGTAVATTVPIVFCQGHVNIFPK